MLNVSSEFRENILRFGRQIDLIISYDDITISGKDIVSCSKKFDGKVFSSVMQYADIELEGYHDVKDKEINIKLGVSYNGCTFSYADFGNFIVDNDSIEKIEETKSTKFTVYDDLIKSHVDYDSSEIVFPCTLKDFLAYICTKCSINHIPVDFPNSNQLILDDPFENITATYRDVLDYIASASGRCIAIDDSYLVVKEYASTGVYIDQNNLSSLKIGKKWGPINSLVLAREPQEDNIYKNDEESILKNGLTEIRISNNYIIEPDRNIFIDDLFNSVKGIAFYSYEIESFGYAYFQPWDLITIVDLSGNEYVSVVMSDHLNITTGMKETIQFEFPDITTTDYSKATKKERKEKNASLYVDKKLNEIVARVNQTETDIEKNSEKIGELELTTEGFKVSISETETKVEEIEKRVTVTSISSQYGISSDKEIAPTSWLDDRPDISEGQYLWMREKYLYSDNTVKYDGVRMISAENGKDAVLLQILSSNGHMFKNTSLSTTLTVEILVSGIRISSSRDMYTYFGGNAKIVWQQKQQGETEYTDIDSNDPRLSDNGFIFTLNAEDLKYETVYNCSLDY